MQHPTNISSAELDVLKVLWDLESATVRDVLAHPIAAGREWAYTTAQTLLGRLADKGYVKKQKDARAFLFVPAVSRDQLVDAELSDLADRVCEGESMPLLLNLVQSQKISPGDLDKLRNLIVELDDEVKS